MMPKVSLFIITYNQAKFVEETLTSALTQDYENLEVVVADDGSTDETPDIIRYYAEKYPRRLIPLIDGPNLGITGNCNRALSACDGKYIACQGGDDVLLPGKISRQVEWLEAYEQRIVCGHDVRIIYTDQKGQESVRGAGGAGRYGVGASKLIKYGIGSFFMGTSMMWRADACPVKGFDVRIPVASDWKFIVDLVGENGVWGGVEGFYALYRRHGNNVTAVRLKTIFKESLLSLALFRKEYPCFSDETAVAKIELLYKLAQYYYRIGDTRQSRRITKSLLACRHQNERFGRSKILKLLVKSLFPASLIKITHQKIIKESVRSN